MRYGEVKAARFLERPNRFVARVETGDEIETVHVKNTGRCRELLVPGARVWLARGTNPGRKYPWDLICAKKQRSADGAVTALPPLLVNLDSQAPNQAVGEWLRAGKLLPGAQVRSEVVHGSSRFDFALDDGNGTLFLEIKGCTLELDGVAAFPDAPTERGVKHLRELTEWAKSGNRAAAFFLIQMRPVKFFTPNAETDPAFAAALREAAAAGVQVLAYDSIVTPDSLTVGEPVEVRL